MATRQELYASIGLIRRTCRVNRHGDSVPIVAQNLENIPELKTIEARKEAIMNTCNTIKQESGNIKTFLNLASPVLLDNGIGAIPFGVTKLNIVADINSSNTLSSNALIALIKVPIELVVIAKPFENYAPESGVIEPNPWKLFPIEINHANILHDILDAMSYELQGKNSYTGQLHGNSIESTKKLISNRIFTGEVYYSHLSGKKLTDQPDEEKMNSVLSYVKTNLVNTDTWLKMENLGKYIDAEIPKLTIIRRWWAL